MIPVENIVREGGEPALAQLEVIGAGECASFLVDIALPVPAEHRRQVHQRLHDVMEGMAKISGQEVPEELAEQLNELTDEDTEVLASILGGPLVLSLN